MRGDWRVLELREEILEMGGGGAKIRHAKYRCKGTLKNLCEFLHIFLL